MPPAAVASDDPDRPGTRTIDIEAADGAPGGRLAFERRGSDVEITLESHGGSAPAPRGEAVDIDRWADAAADAVRAEMGRPALDDVTWHLAADHPADDLDPRPEAVARHLGLGTRRDLLQLRRPLPVPADHPVRVAAPALETRAFRPGEDDAAWIEVNNRAFAHHPDQGQENGETLAARQGHDWFDPQGFLVADDPRRPGSMLGFCWTKVHPASADTKTLGEIYVIGVDPSHQGEGLGPALVLAGLDHLVGCDITESNLYVEADNRPARRLYDRLGYQTHQRRRVYTP